MFQIGQVPIPDYADKSLALLIGLLGGALGVLITGYLTGLSNFIHRIDALEQSRERHERDISALVKALQDSQAVNSLTATSPAESNTTA